MARINSRRVAKSNPEMQAVLANIDSLVDELQSLSMGGGDGLDPDDGGGDVLDPRAAKGDEPFRTPSNPGVATDPSAPPKAAGVAPWDDPVQKALSVLKAAGFEVSNPKDKEDDEAVAKAQKLFKAIMASDSDGPTGESTGEESVSLRPDYDDENIDEVKKALAKILGMSPNVARKSAPSSRFAQTTDALVAITKSLADRVQKSDAILEEVLEGLGIAKTVTEDPAARAVSGQVRKSQGPIMQYGNEFGDVIGQSVAKALEPFLATLQRPSNTPTNWDRETDVNKSMGEAGLMLGELAGNSWGQRYSAAPVEKKE